MGKLKKLFMEMEEKDSANWVTKRCYHCNELYCHNVVTGRDDEFNYCDKCYAQLVYGVKIR